MSEKHFFGKVAQKALIVKDGKVLITRDVGDPDIWELPGGRLNEDEGLEPGMEREIFEELGVKVKINKLAYSEQYHQARDGQLSLLLAYEAFLVDPDLMFVIDPKEVAETRWIGPEDLKDYKIYGNCLNALKAYWKR